MKHQPQQTSPVTASQFRAIEAQLTKAAALMAEAARHLEDSQKPELWCFNWKIAQQSLKFLANFRAEVETALFQDIAGTPQTKETRKARSRPAEPPPKKRKG